MALDDASNGRTDDEANWAALLNRARDGDREAIGLLLEPYRPYLRMLVRMTLRKSIVPGADHSDVVQETILAACGGLPQFRGQSMGELLRWLRTLLTRTLAARLAHEHAACRDSRRVRPLDATWLNASRAAHDWLNASATTPSGAAIRNEESLRMARALDRLPTLYRDVIVARGFEGKPFAVIGKDLSRSGDAARLLWVRAMQELGRQLRAPW